MADQVETANRELELLQTLLLAELRQDATADLELVALEGMEATVAMGVPAAKGETGSQSCCNYRQRASRLSFSLTVWKAGREVNREKAGSAAEVVLVAGALLVVKATAQAASGMEAARSSTRLWYGIV